ncbi:MAG: hypothetical protein DMF10_10575 [Verrucomicrobia bacterium]|nr:MAG: hypothetical protein DMF10_10575 [Verrucomicrobiota bacterium]
MCPRTNLPSTGRGLSILCFRLLRASTGNEAEALLLILFINAGHEGSPGPNIIGLWRGGDADALNRLLQDSFRDFPSLGRRIIDVRNRNWLPKIEGYLRSGHTYFVVVGAGHLGGPNGLLALLRARGYKIEQL